MDRETINRSSEIDRELNYELSDDSESELELNISGDEDSEDVLSSLFGDDTDEDPSYYPENEEIPSTSSVFTPRGRPNLRGSSHGQRARSHQQRPVDRSVLSSSETSDDDNDDDRDRPRYKWVKINEGYDNFTHSFDYSENPGPKHCPPLTGKPIDYFDLFFTESILRMFVKETNRYADQTLAEKGQNLTPRSRLRSWYATTLLEMKTFIIVIINMGLVRKPTIKSYWSGSSSQTTSWFAKIFTRDRFENLLGFFHMVDNSKLPKPNNAGYDPCQKFQPLQDHCNQVFNFYYQPHKHLSVDESLIGTKSQTQMMQYLPNKHHHRWGVKLWVLCDSESNYCLSFFCYKGKFATEDRDEVKNNGLAYVVVSKLLTSCRLLGKGYHVFTDNFYTNLPLVDYLYTNKTFMTGTVKKNRKYLPEEVKNKLLVGQKVYCKLENKPFVALAYRQKKSQKLPVILLSSKPEVQDVEVTKRRHGRITTEKKPSIVQNYCQYMGGIDTFDMMLYSYLDERRSMKYWRKVSCNLFARMVVNCYVLYNENCKKNNVKPMSRYAFIVNIIDSVTEQWLGDQLTNRAQPGGPVGLVALPGTQTKTCWVCTPKGKNYNTSRKRSRLVCCRCNEGCHGTCMAKHICK